MVSKAIHKAIRNETITVYNPDNFFNNAVWIDDLVDFIKQLSRKRFDKHQTFLLGAEEQLSIRYIMELIKERTLSQSKIKFSKAKNSFTLDFSSAIKAGYKTCPLENMLVKQIDNELLKK